MDEKKLIGDGREETFACFRTVSGLQNLVHASDAKPRIQFSTPYATHIHTPASMGGA